MTNETKKYLVYGAVGLVVIGGIAYYMLEPKNAIVREAHKYLGAEEYPNNAGFKSPAFEKKMNSIGWYTGAQWCSFFAKLVFTKALIGKRKELAEQLISGSSQQTWANFKADKSGLFETSDKPKRGSLVIWQSYTAPAQGHVGIVVDPAKKFFKTIEGNSNFVVVNLRDLKKNIKKDNDKVIKATESEGKVSYHIRQYTGDGMKLLGFVNVK